MDGRPNIVIVMSDQQRADSLGCYGNGFTATPNLDRLAQGGVVFERAFTPFPVCTPARATMWTGLYPHRHGITWNYYGVDNLFEEVASQKTTVFELLRDAGYLTAYFGKWHLGEKPHPAFDVWDGFNSRGGHWEGGYQSFQGGTWKPAAQTDACIAFLESERARERPFVMVQGYYPPHNPLYRGQGDEKPPLLVMSHGGPTSRAPSHLQLKIQFWTSRGFAVLDVNYRGSTGYGRHYRQKLDGQWGLADVEDCINGARYLIERGEVDGERLAIRGGSAGGYTTLCALTFHDFFHAGASHFGVGDLEALTKETHKFESRYLDSLVGAYPEMQERYRQRSPIHFVEQINGPIIFFQGLEDAVVLPEQAEVMVEALRRRGLPVAYLPFAGEQHGFRRAETMRRVLEAELYFYSRIFGFEPADEIEPLTIENLTG